MTFIDKYDITGRLVQFHFMPMFNDIEWLTKDKSNDVSLTEQRLPNTRSDPSWVVGVFVDQDKKNMVLLVLKQTERSLVSHPQENDTEVWRSSASDISLCRTIVEKRLQVQEGQAETIHIQSTTPTKTVIFRTLLTCNQLCIYAAVCVGSDQYKQKQSSTRQQ